MSENATTTTSATTETAQKKDHNRYRKDKRKFIHFQFIFVVFLVFFKFSFLITTQQLHKFITQINYFQKKHGTLMTLTIGKLTNSNWEI